MRCASETPSASEREAADVATGRSRAHRLPYATLWGLVTERLLPRLELPHQRSIYIRRVDLEQFIDDHMSEVTS